MSDIAFLKKTMAFKGLTYDASKSKEENQKIFISHESGKTKKADSAGPKKTIVKTPLSARKKQKSAVTEDAQDDDEEKIAFFKTERPKLIKTGKFKSELALQTELKKMWEATKDKSSPKGIHLYTELTIELSAEDQAAMGLEKIGTKGDGNFIYRPIATPSKKEKSPVKKEKKEEVVIDDDDDDDEADEEGDEDGDEEDDEAYEETEVIDKAQLVEFLKKNVQKHIWKSIMSDMGEKVSGTMTELIDRFLGKFHEYEKGQDDEDDEGEEGDEEDEEEDDEE